MWRVVETAPSRAGPRGGLQTTEAGALPACPPPQTADGQDWTPRPPCIMDRADLYSLWETRWRLRSPFLERFPHMYVGSRVYGMQRQRVAHRRGWRGPGPLFSPAQHQSSRVWQQLFCFYSQTLSFPFPVHCSLMRLTGDKHVTQDWPARNPILLVWFVQDEQVDWKNTQRNTTSVDPQGLHLR